jgi:hypothetical protein
VSPAPLNPILFKEDFNHLDSTNHWAHGGDCTVTGHFLNLSTNNHWYRDHKRNENYDRGSNWTAFKSAVEMSQIQCKVQLAFGSAGIFHGYDGPLMVHNGSDMEIEDFQDLPIGASDEDQLAAFGSTAISRVLPTNPISDLPTAVGELLSEGLPRAIGQQLLRRGAVSPHSLSGEYLNVEFGLKPFFRDMQAFGHAASNAERLINQYARDAGRKIRRKYKPAPITEVEDIVFDNNSGFQHYLGPLSDSSAGGYLTPALGGWPGVRTDTNTRVKTQWFSGAFTYYLPGVNDFAGKLLREEAEMRHLYGGLSVDTAWNLLPFSWAADWISNAGDVLHNVSQFARDGLVMPWGYVMEKNELHNYRKVEGARFQTSRMVDDIFHFPDVVSTTFSVVYMRRRKATPFGFGLDISGFTTRQKAILGAVGIILAS